MLVSRPQLTDQQATLCEEHQLFTNNVMIFRWHSLAEEGFHRNTLQVIVNPNTNTLLLQDCTEWAYFLHKLYIWGGGSSLASL